MTWPLAAFLTCVGFLALLWCEGLAYWAIATAWNAAKSRRRKGSHNLTR